MDRQYNVAYNSTLLCGWLLNIQHCMHKNRDRDRCNVHLHKTLCWRNLNWLHILYGRQAVNQSSRASKSKSLDCWPCGNGYFGHMVMDCNSLEHHQWAVLKKVCNLILRFVRWQFKSKPIQHTFDFGTCNVCISSVTIWTIAHRYMIDNRTKCFPSTHIRAWISTFIIDTSLIPCTFGV